MPLVTPETLPANISLLKQLVSQTLLDLHRLGEVYDWDTILMRSLRAMMQRQNKCLELIEPLLPTQK